MKKIITIGIVALFLGLVFLPISSAKKSEIKTNGISESPVYKALVSKGAGDSDYWYYFTANAQEWFQNWCKDIQSGSFDNFSISKRVESYNISVFYIIAHSHGESTRFLTKEGDYYTADILRQDMMNRSPIKFAFICCCEGMSYTGPGSLSYEFRKGQLNDTVTVGYANFSEYKENGGSMWTALSWQDLLLYHVNRGLTIKKAFDIACWGYPTIADYVKFVGDPNLRITDSPIDSPDKAQAKTSNIFLSLNKPLFSFIDQILFRFPSFEKILFNTLKP